jgi:CRP-like cAMP-binding protein
MLEYCANLRVATMPSDAVLIEEGRVPASMYVLRSGSVVVERDGVPFARIHAPGAVFGEMSWVLGKEATATVRATDDIEVHVIDDPEDFFTRDEPRAALEVLRMTASRLDGMTQYLVDVKRQFADQAGHLGMVDQILDTLIHHQRPVARPGSVRDPEVC